MGEVILTLFSKPKILKDIAENAILTILINKCDNLYCKASEFGIRYDDPEIGIKWPVEKDKIITSEKDRLANRLQDILNMYEREEK